MVDEKLYDIIITIPRDDTVERWRTFDYVFVPGARQPKSTDAGARLWLRFGGRLVLRAEIERLREDESRRNRKDGAERGRGWTLVVGEWDEVDRTDAELGFTGQSWGQGYRYLDPDTLLLRTAQARAAQAVGARVISREQVSPDTVVSHQPEEIAAWNRAESELVEDWAAWCEAGGFAVKAIEIRTPEGAVLRADAYVEAQARLVEAKGSSTREHVRMAIGQVLDYSSLVGWPHTRAILVPDPLPPSLRGLALGLDIGVIHRAGDAFEEHLPA